MRGLLLSMTLAWTVIYSEGAVFAATPTVLVGHAISQEDLDLQACPDDDPGLCMSSWFRWTLQIDRTLQGPAIKGRIATAHRQHSRYQKWYQKEVSLFVVTPIEDPQQRQRLRADYFLEDFSQRLPMYCLSLDPADLGLELHGGVFVQSFGGMTCFQDPESVGHH
jgi:hypothetical protein